jgi:hypothetical protein
MSTAAPTTIARIATVALLLFAALLIAIPPAQAASGTTSLTINVSPAAVTLLNAHRATAAENAASLELLSFVADYAKQLERRPPAESAATVLQQIAGDAVLWMEGEAFRVDGQGVHEHQASRQGHTVTAYSL